MLNFVLNEKASIWLWLIISVVALGTIGTVVYKASTDYASTDLSALTGKPKNQEIISPFSKLKQEIINKVDPNNYEKSDPYPLGKPIVGVLFGIDRRSRDEGYRTDIMIVAAANPETNKVVLISIPRDLWYGSGRINALYPADGWPAFQEAAIELTGLKPERFVLTDFKDFSWVVDAMSGVPVEVETTFTDQSYPVDETKGYQTVSFQKGQEVLTGERALIYARSRKGDFDNGDWGRMKRQHNILKGMLKAVLQPESLFNPMVVEKAFETVTQGKMDTNLSVVDAKYLWDFYKDKDKYEIISLYMDYDYLYVPPAEEYGGAWVMAPKPGGIDNFKKLISDKLNNITYPEVDQSNEPIHP